MPDAVAPLGPGTLLRLKAEHLVPCTYHFYRDPPQIVRGAGPYLFDHEGRRYLDAHAGISVVNAGHCHPHVVAAATAQLGTLQHVTSIHLVEPTLRLAARLAEIAPGDLRRTFFCASGTEAVEGALLAAAIATGRSEILAFGDALHGRTRWAMEATGLPMWKCDPHPPGGVHRVPFGDADAVERTLAEHGGRIAAVIGEPIQGNGGFNLPPAGFWPRVRRACDAHGALLVLDEMQTGFNRTGRWFASEHWGVVPDVMAIGKALGNGLPIAAWMTTDAVAARIVRPMASTFGGNPVAAAAALATLEVHEREALGARAADLGRLLLQGLREIATRHAARLGEPRGLGLMIGVPVVDVDGRPDADGANGLHEALRERGVLACKAGPDRNVIGFLPPLVVDAELIGGLIDAFNEAMDATRLPRADRMDRGLRLASAR